MAALVSAGAAAPVAGGIGRRHGVKRLGEADPKVVAALDFGVGTTRERRVDLAGDGGFRRVRRWLGRDARRRGERGSGFIGGEGQAMALWRGKGWLSVRDGNGRATAALSGRRRTPAGGWGRRAGKGQLGFGPVGPVGAVVRGYAAERRLQQQQQLLRARPGAAAAAAIVGGERSWRGAGKGSRGGGRGGSGDRQQRGRRAATAADERDKQRGTVMQGGGTRAWRARPTRDDATRGSVGAGW
nr:spidroin-1-like [Aegilops tauschii subsp. strangulata]